MVIETFLNIFLCYSSLQCNRIPYYSPKHYIESTAVGNIRQLTVKWCSDTAILPKVYLNDVCRCVPSQFYWNFMYIKDGIRRGQFNGFKMNCTQVFNATDAITSRGIPPQTAAPSRISTALAQLLRLRGVSPIDIARIQARGLSEAQLEQLKARRKLSMAEVAFMQAIRVPVQQINAYQVRGLLPSEIRVLRARGRLPSVAPGMPGGPFPRPMSNPIPSARLPEVTPITGIISNRFGGRLHPRGIGGQVIAGGLPLVTPIRSPLGIMGSPDIMSPTIRRITKFQELQLLSRQANPLQLIRSVRGLSTQDLLSVAREMTADQFVAMRKILTAAQREILTAAQRQQLLPNLTTQMANRLTSSQTSQESLRAFQNLLTPRQIMQLSAEQIERLGAVLAAMDGDKSQLPEGLLPTSNGDAATGTGLPFTQPDPTSLIGTSPMTTGTTVVGADESIAPGIGTIVISGDKGVGGEGSVTSTGTGTLTPVNKDSGAAKMILFDVVSTDPGDSHLNKDKIVEGISPIGTSGSVVDTSNLNVPGPPSPDSQLTSASLVVNNNVVNSPFQPTAGGSIVETSAPDSTNTATTEVTGNTYADGISLDIGSDTTNINPNYKIIAGKLPSDICEKCENSNRQVACYLPHETSCNLFVQCVTDQGTRLRSQIMQCYPHTFWNQTLRTCVQESKYCTMPTGLENLPKEPTIEAPIEYDSVPTQPAVETTTPIVDPSSEPPPPNYAPFERVDALVEMSLYPAPPSGSGLVFPDAAPSGLNFPDINTGVQS